MFLRCAAESFAVLRRIAPNLLKSDKTRKLGVKSRRLLAGWDERYLFAPGRRQP